MGANDLLAFLEAWGVGWAGGTWSRLRLSRPWVTLASAETEQIKRPRREGLMEKWLGDRQMEDGLGELTHG